MNTRESDEKAHPVRYKKMNRPISNLAIGNAPNFNFSASARANLVFFLPLSARTFFFWLSVCVNVCLCMCFYSLSTQQTCYDIFDSKLKWLSLGIHGVEQVFRIICPIKKASINANVANSALSKRIECNRISI